MNTETGEFKNFTENEKIPEDWVEWSEDALLEIKGVLFRVIEVDVKNDTVKLKAINKQTRKKVIEKLLEVIKKFIAESRSGISIVSYAIIRVFNSPLRYKLSLYRLMVRTLGFQSKNNSSILFRGIYINKELCY